MARTTKRVNFSDVQYGPEYQPGAKISDATTWYHYVCDEKQAKKFLIEYFKSIEDKENLDYFSSISASDIYMWGATCCWYARMLSIGYANINMERFHEYLNDIKTKVESNKTKEKYIAEKSKTVSPISERIYRNAVKSLNDILDIIDINHPKTVRFEPNGFVKILQTNGVMKFYENFIVGEIKEILSNLDRALVGTENEDFDSYKRIGYSVYLLKKKREFVSLVLLEVEEYFSNISDKVKTISKISDDGTFSTEIIPDKKTTKSVDPTKPKIRKPRRKKIQSLDKLTSKLNYLKEYKEMNLISVDPKKIFGSTELWLYNTKYKKLTVIKAKPNQTLAVKGSTVLNFDEAASITKIIGKHTNEILQSVLTNGKVALRKVMPSILATEVLATGRINDDTIILRVL